MKNIGNAQKKKKKKKKKKRKGKHRETLLPSFRE